MAEKILLIAPRWMPSAVMQQKVQLWHGKFPRAHFTLLSAAPLENSILNHLFLPPLQKREMLSFALHLRRTRFRYAVVLSDNSRGDVGYGEAKFWAFAANARRREFEDKPLTLPREAKAKRKVALVWAARLATLPQHGRAAPRRAETIVPAQMLNSARTFVYLQHAAHQHGLEPGRVVLAGPDWDEETAWRCGWQVTQEKSDAHLLLIGGTDDKNLSDSTMQSICLICLSGLKELVQPLGRLREVENHAAFFDETARDVWLVNAL